MVYSLYISVYNTPMEMDTFAVVSRNSTKQKMVFASAKVYPQFAIIDPETNYSLPLRQVTRRRKNYGVTDEMCREIVRRFKESGLKLGDRQNIGYKEIEEILALCD